MPSPTSGFHSSYYLGLGWGIAEAVWGIVQGYEQLALYQDVMRPEEEDQEEITKIENGQIDRLSNVGSLDEEQYLDEIARADEAELERKVEALERMRERRGELSRTQHGEELTVQTLKRYSALLSP